MTKYICCNKKMKKINIIYPIDNTINDMVDYVCLECGTIKRHMVIDEDDEYLIKYLKKHNLKNSKIYKELIKLTMQNNL